MPPAPPGAAPRPRPAPFGTVAEDLRLLALSGWQPQPQLLDARGAARRSAGGQGLALGPQPARHRWIARQVETLLDGDHRRQRYVVDVTAGGRLLLAADAVVLHGDALDAGHAGAPQRVRDADADLVVAGVGRLVAEEDQIELAARRPLGLDRGDDRRRRGLAVELVGRLEQDRAVDAQRHRVAQLLLGLRRA